MVPGEAASDARGPVLQLGQSCAAHRRRQPSRSWFTDKNCWHDRNKKILFPTRAFGRGSSAGRSSMVWNWGGGLAVLHSQESMAENDWGIKRLNYHTVHSVFQNTCVGLVAYRRAAFCTALRRARHKHKHRLSPDADASEQRTAQLCSQTCLHKEGVVPVAFVSLSSIARTTFVSRTATNSR